ncbi:MAG: hypothetical protein N3A59_04170 [Thermodesulfovibrionales bacterium]|nr:hypothetical protein [Thermodesulfovibrionales bacterium]
MKKRNTGKSWTKYELAKIKYHFKAISKSIPFFIVFLLPGGMLLLSILALYLDRRKKKRRSF